MSKFLRTIGIVLTLVLAIGVLAPGSVLALEYRYGYFPDLDDAPWAKQVTIKMNLRGVAGGIPDPVTGVTYFKPNDNVTQLQAILFASRTMGLQDKANNVAVGRYLPFVVPDWARASVIVAMDEGLIGNNFDANSTASRAWVAQLLVKMIGKEQEVGQVGNDVLPFSDSHLIPSQYVNYVKVANKYGLIAGNADNTFAPNQTVTRAQMVAFLSRAERHLELKDSKLLLGTITQINGNNIGLRSSGQDYTLIRNISSNLYGPTGEIWVTDLRVNDQVYVIVEGNTIKYLEVGNFSLQNQPTAPSQATGVIMQVFSGQNTLVIRNNENKIETITLTSSTSIVNDKSVALTINQLAKDMEVRVAYTAGKPSTITVITQSALTGDEGVVFNINPEIKLLTLKKGESLAAYLYNDNTQIIVGTNPLASMGDIKEGDKVKVEATDGLLEKLHLVAKEVELTNRGIVKLISVDSRLITYETNDKELKAFYVEPNARISFSGDIGLLADIREGDTIEVNIENSRVTSLSVTNRKLYEKMQGILVSNDHTNRIITLRDTSNQLQAYEVTQGAEIKVNNRTAHLYDVKRDMQLELELNEGKITYLGAKDTLLGTVVGINTGTRVMDVTLTTGERKTYNIHNNVSIHLEGTTNYSLSNINRGDLVEVRVVDGRITEIKAQRVVTYRITEVTPNSNRIRVIDNRGNTRYLYFYSDVELDVYGKFDPKVSDLKVNDIIKATYLGYTLQKVEMAPVILGTVSSVSSLERTVVVKGYDGQSHSFKFENNSRVTKNNVSYTNLGPVVVGDRVVVEENLEGGRVFGLMNKVTGQVGHLYNDKSRVFLKETQTTWKQYDMVATAYLHNGTRELTPAEFKMDDHVELFIANNKVYEVLRR